MDCNVQQFEIECPCFLQYLQVSFWVFVLPPAPLSKAALFSFFLSVFFCLGFLGPRADLGRMGVEALGVKFALSVIPAAIRGISIVNKVLCVSGATLVFAAPTVDSISSVMDFQMIGSMD